MVKRQQHWEQVYKTKEHKTLGWYQASPKISLQLLLKIEAEESKRIIDVGCGASHLADNLIFQTYENITLVDFSQSALDAIKKRLGEKGDIPNYVCADVSHPYEFDGEFDIWHDRAVFHFLLKEDERKGYMDNLSHYLTKDGHAIIGTFAVGGPTKCCGLDIIQYDRAKMQAQLPEHLEVVETIDNIHIKPSGEQQEYLFFIIRHR